VSASLLSCRDRDPHGIAGRRGQEGHAHLTREPNPSHTVAGIPLVIAHPAGLGEAPGQALGAPAWEPTPEQMATMRADAEVFLAHLLRPTTNYRPASTPCARRHLASSPSAPPRRAMLTDPA
jgi:hypothetical protein